VRANEPIREHPGIAREQSIVLDRIRPAFRDAGFIVELVADGVIVGVRLDPGG
jgi:hypothetical protein